MSRSLVVLLFFVAACAPGRQHASDSSTDAEPELLSAAATPIPSGDYEQDPQYLLSMDLSTTEFMYMTVYPAGQFSRTRCLSNGCARRIGDAGSFTLTHTRSGVEYVRFAFGGASPTSDRYAYEIDGSTVWLRRSGTNDWFPMVAVHALWSETLCDDTHGSWSDDDTAPDGTFCQCASGFVWTAETGCT
jgi:hypothetical protein